MNLINTTNIKLEERDLFTISNIIGYDLHLQGMIGAHVAKVIAEHAATYGSAVFSCTFHLQLRLIENTLTDKMELDVRVSFDV